MNPGLLPRTLERFLIRFFDPESRITRKMGFKTESLGLMNRYLREKEYWKSHLQNTRNFIIQSIGKKTGKKLAVLGSGWLLDLPMEFLLERYQKVLLFDLVHPRQLIHKYRHDQRVRFIRADLTGNALYKAYELSLKPLSWKTKTITFRKFRFSSPVDYVISLNILSQLPAYPGDYLRKNTYIPEAVIQQFLNKIQMNHLNLLRQYPSCLISDVREITHCKGGKKLEEKTVFIDLPLTKNSRQWKWTFDTSGWYHEDCETIYQVRAWSFDPET
jgi:hypothetical protein